MKTLLLTGASGFLGSRIANFYHKRYHIYAPPHNEMDITNEDNVFSVFDKYKDRILLCIVPRFPT